MQKTNLQQAAANIFTDGELYIKPLFQDLFYFKIYLHTVSHKLFPDLLVCLHPSSLHQNHKQ